MLFEGWDSLGNSGLRKAWLSRMPGAPGESRYEKKADRPSNQSTEAWDLPTSHPTHFHQFYVPLVQSPDTR